MHLGVGLGYARRVSAKNHDAKPAGDDERPASPTRVESKAPARGPKILHKVHLDPATGFGIFVPGLFVMALGGAMTWHWIFNIGSGIMLAGMTYVVAAIMLTALQQRFDKKRSSAAPAG